MGAIAPLPVVRGLSRPKTFMNNKRMEEFQEHFYKLAGTGSAQSLNNCAAPKIQIYYGAVSGSKMQVCLFDMMLRHHDTSLRPLTLTLRLTYTTSGLDDITFRQRDLSTRRDHITFCQHRLLLRRDDITYRLNYRTFNDAHALKTTIE